LSVHALRLGVAASVLLLFGAAQAQAQTVSLSGSMGNKALLVIDGTPRTVAAGSTHAGVKLVSVSTNDAVVEINGKRVALTQGGTPVNLGGAASEGSGSQIVLNAVSGGHFVSSGSINGKAVRFMVDTGATFISISQQEADRIGLNYRNGARGYSQTANGAIPVYRIMLDSVRVGDVQVFNVEALVSPAPMEMVLLGNSFLSRFQMRRDNDVMRLEKR
jgi:aspartyl protease family protein